MSERKINPVLHAKLFPRSSTREAEKIDTAKENRDFRKRNDILMDAFTAWNSLEEFRRQSVRNRRYVFGNQWGDRIKNPDGPGYITEEDHIKKQGKIPLKNNRMRGIVNSVLGVFSSAQTEPVCIARDRGGQQKGEIMSVTLQYNYQLNKLWELDKRNLEYFLITGLASFRSSFGYRNGKMDVWTDIVNYHDFFFDNHTKDPRHWDCHLVGRIHDVGLYDVMAQFAKGSKRRADEIRQIYRYVDKERTVSYLTDNLTEDTLENKNFFIPDEETRCRVIEIWKKESKERLLVHDTLKGEYYRVELENERNIIAENIKRIQEQGAQGVSEQNMKLIEYKWIIDNYWYYYFMSPQGDVLDEGETPYWHESHPYSFKVYPFYDGMVFPFVASFIDQQRYINRLITMQDFIMGASAKGVLMFPEECLPEGMKMSEIAQQWVSYNGMILYKAKPGIPAPEQIIASTTNTGAYDMLAIQLKLLEDISGVQGALQGKTPSAGTPASLYAQQTQNSTTTLTDLLESYRGVREERDTKTMKLIQQSYTEVRYMNINGADTNRKAMVYNPGEVMNAEFDLSITESTSTPAYRMVMNDFLMQMFQTGQLTLKELLENGAFPFADKLLQSIQAKEEEMAQQQAGMGGAMIPANIQQQIQAGTNPQVAQLLNKQV
ncbi:hypothetical protein EZS27_019649 [termite gut metagenome]|uniref:Portal protein n=1 Tax=termite gut metagenome TaxID=433724 RepID=A0A5J4RDN5_9ZZZZ